MITVAHQLMIARNRIKVKGGQMNTQCFKTGVTRRFSLRAIANEGDMKDTADELIILS